MFLSLINLLIIQCKNSKNFSIPEPIFSCNLYEMNIISLNYTSNFSISCEGDAYDLHCCWLHQPKRRRSGYIAAHDSIYCIMIYLVDGIIHCSHYQVTIEYTSLGVCSKLVTGMLSVCSWSWKQLLLILFSFSRYVLLI